MDLRLRSLVSELRAGSLSPPASPAKMPRGKVRSVHTPHHALEGESAGGVGSLARAGIPAGGSVAAAPGVQGGVDPGSTLMRALRPLLDELQPEPPTERSPASTPSAVGASKAEATHAAGSAAGAAASGHARRVLAEARAQDGLKAGRAQPVELASGDGGAGAPSAGTAEPSPPRRRVKAGKGSDWEAEWAEEDEREMKEGGEAKTQGSLFQELAKLLDDTRTFNKASKDLLKDLNKADEAGVKKGGILKGGKKSRKSKRGKKVAEAAGADSLTIEDVDEDEVM